MLSLSLSLTGILGAEDAHGPSSTCVRPALADLLLVFFCWLVFFFFILKRNPAFEVTEDEQIVPRRWLARTTA